MSSVRDILKGYNSSIMGMSRIESYMIREIDIIRNMNTCILEGDLETYYNFGDTPVILFTEDINELGAFVIYLAKQLECSAVLMEEDLNMLINYNSDIPFYEAKYIIKIHCNKPDEKLISLDEYHYKTGNIICEKFKWIMEKPFGPNEVGSEPNNIDRSQLPKKFKENVIEVGVKGSFLKYDFGPILRTYVLIYSFFKWINLLLGSGSVSSAKILSYYEMLDDFDKLALLSSQLTNSLIDKAIQIRSGKDDISLEDIKSNFIEISEQIDKIV